MDRPLARQFYPEGDDGATYLPPTCYRPTGDPAHSIAVAAPLCTVRHPGCVARNDTGRSPNRDRSG